MIGNAVLKYYKPQDLNHHYFDVGNKKFKVADLIESSKGLEIFDLPIDGIDLYAEPWEHTSKMGDFADHLIRIKKSDLSKPIIINDYGYICDGWHRLMKAIMKNQKTIKAVRLIHMPKKFEIIEATNE